MIPAPASAETHHTAPPPASPARTLPDVRHVPLATLAGAPGTIADLGRILPNPRGPRVQVASFNAAL